MWNSKGEKLDKVLQIRLFESESEKQLSWMVLEVETLANDHTNIGDCLATAQMKKNAFSEYKSNMMVRRGMTGVWLVR